MSRMTADKWKAMSDQEQIDYLEDHPIEVVSKSFMDGSKKVGDYSAVSKKYSAKIGRVVMTGWVDSEEKARQQAENNLSAMIADLTNE